MQHCEKVRAKQCDRDRSTRGMEIEGELSLSLCWPLRWWVRRLAWTLAGFCKNLSRSPTLSLASPLLFSPDSSEKNS